jgi:hypothetical protein
MDHREAATNHAVERYLLDELSTGERDRFEEHFFECMDCAEAVKSGFSLIENGKAVVKEGYRPSRPGGVAEMPIRRARPNRSAWQSIASVAATVLVAITTYQNLVTIPRLREKLTDVERPRVLAHVLLRPAARGRLPVLKLDGNHFVGLDLEVNEASNFPSYRIDLQTSSGTLLYNLASPPAPDGSIEVELPASELRPGEYAILVRGQAGNAVTDPGPELGRYPFEVQK